jgi:hypothetical protein
LYGEAGVAAEREGAEASQDADDANQSLSNERAKTPHGLDKLILIGSRSYSAGPTFRVGEDHAGGFDSAKVDAWAKEHAPNGGGQKSGNLGRGPLRYLR